jgi:hypothetical protein
VFEACSSDRVAEERASVGDTIWWGRWHGATLSLQLAAAVDCLARPVSVDQSA